MEQLAAAKHIQCSFNPLDDLRDREAFNNPTIIIITDREDLDTQASELFVTAKYLHEKDVRSIETRKDLSDTLNDKPSGGVYITTIQKFCETTGLLSDRSNIICISMRRTERKPELEPNSKD